MSNLVTRGLGGTNLVTFGLGGPWFNIHISTGGRASAPPIRYRQPPEREDDDDVEPWRPPEDEQEVIIKIRMGKRKIERHYFVRKRTSKVVTEVLHLLNNTKSKIKIHFNGIQQTAKAIAIKVFNLNKMDK